MRDRPQQINRKNAASYPLAPGRFYNGVVTSVSTNGQVTVRVASLNSSFGPAIPVGATPYSRMSVGDSVVCTFTDEFFKNIVVFGSSKVKADVFAKKTLFEQLQTKVDSLEARIEALEAE